MVLLLGNLHGDIVAFECELAREACAYVRGLSVVSFVFFLLSSMRVPQFLLSTNTRRTSSAYQIRDHVPVGTDVMSPRYGPKKLEGKVFGRSGGPFGTGVRDQSTLRDGACVTGIRAR